MNKEPASVGVAVFIVTVVAGVCMCGVTGLLMPFIS